VKRPIIIASTYAIALIIWIVAAAFIAISRALSAGMEEKGGICIMYVFWGIVSATLFVFISVYKTLSTKHGFYVVLMSGLLPAITWFVLIIVWFGECEYSTLLSGFEILVACCSIATIVHLIISKAK